MATKKATKKAVKAKCSKRGDSVQLPDGYKTIGRAPGWDVEKHPVIKGERGPARDVVMNEGTKKEYETQTMVVVDEEIGAVTVWKSAMLADLFDSTEEGDHIRIEFLGYGPAKKGQQAAKLFACAVKE